MPNRIVPQANHKKRAAEVLKSNSIDMALVGAHELAKGYGKLGHPAEGYWLATLEAITEAESRRLKRMCSKTADKKLLEALSKYHSRAWVLVENKDGEFGVIDNSRGLEVLTDWYDDFRMAIADAEASLIAGKIQLHMERARR